MSWRVILGLPLAGAVVVFLFLVMGGMIDPGDITPEEPPERETISILPDFEEPAARRDRPRPPEAIEPPDPPDTDIEPTIDAPTMGREGLGPLRPGGDPDGLTLPSLDRDVQPIVRVDPQGFERCFGPETAFEQRVKLRFDVSPLGETANIEVVSSTDRCFDRPARRAVERWRYAPKVEKGANVWRYGLETVIVFRIDG